MSKRNLALLERWACYLPKRVAEEDVGGFIEQLNREPMRGVELIFFTGQALLFTSWNALIYSANNKPSRRTTMTIAVLNILFAIIHSPGAIVQLHHGRPDALLQGQAALGLLLSVLWIVSAVMIIRRHEHARSLTLATAAATVLHSVWLSNLHAWPTTIAMTVYPLAVILYFTMSRQTPAAA